MCINCTGGPGLQSLPQYCERSRVTVRYGSPHTENLDSRSINDVLCAERSTQDVQRAKGTVREYDGDICDLGSGSNTTRKEALTIWNLVAESEMRQSRSISSQCVTLQTHSAVARKLSSSPFL